MSALDQKLTLRSAWGMSALPPIADIDWARPDVRFVPKADLMSASNISSDAHSPCCDALTLVPPASTYVCVLHRYGLPPTIDLAHDTGADASALRLVNIAMYVELRMHHGHVRCQKADMHNWRLASTHPEWPTGAVKSPH